jgi:hypothetical protein
VIQAPDAVRAQRAGNRKIRHDADDFVPAVERDVLRVGLAAPADVADPSSKRIGACEQPIDHRAVHEHSRIAGVQFPSHCDRHAERVEEIDRDLVHEPAARTSC